MRRITSYLPVVAVRRTSTQGGEATLLASTDKLAKPKPKPKTKPKPKPKPKQKQKISQTVPRVVAVHLHLILPWILPRTSGMLEWVVAEVGEVLGLATVNKLWGSVISSPSFLAPYEKIWLPICRVWRKQEIRETAKSFRGVLKDYANFRKLFQHKRAYETTVLNTLRLPPRFLENVGCASVKNPHHRSTESRLYDRGEVAELGLLYWGSFANWERNRGKRKRKHARQRSV